MQHFQETFCPIVINYAQSSKQFCPIEQFAQSTMPNRGCSFAQSSSLPNPVVLSFAQSRILCHKFECKSTSQAVGIVVSWKTEDSANTFQFFFTKLHAMKTKSTQPSICLPQNVYHKNRLFFSQKNFSTEKVFPKQKQVLFVCGEAVFKKNNCFLFFMNICVDTTVWYHSLTDNTFLLQEDAKTILIEQSNQTFQLWVYVYSCNLVLKTDFIIFNRIFKWQILSDAFDYRNRHIDSWDIGHDLWV